MHDVCKSHTGPKLSEFKPSQFLPSAVHDAAVTYLFLSPALQPSPTLCSSSSSSHNTLLDPLPTPPSSVKYPHSAEGYLRGHWGGVCEGGRRMGVRGVMADVLGKDVALSEANGWVGCRGGDPAIFVYAHNTNDARHFCAFIALDATLPVLLLPASSSPQQAYLDSLPTTKTSRATTSSLLPTSASPLALPPSRADIPRPTKNLLSRKGKKAPHRPSTHRNHVRPRWEGPYGLYRS